MYCRNEAVTCVDYAKHEFLQNIYAGFSFNFHCLFHWDFVVLNMHSVIHRHA